MHTQTTAAPMGAYTQPNTAAPSLLTVEQFCRQEPAFTPGGIRHLFFTKGHDLPGVHRFGRKILIDPAEFITGIKSGQAHVIAGRGAA